MMLPWKQYKFPTTVCGYISSFILLCTTLLCLSCSESPEQVLQRMDTEAEQYLADKQYNQAINTWNNLLALQPEAPGIYSKIAQAYQLTGLYPQALQAFQKHLTQNPASSETIISIMKLQLQRFDIAGASDSWENLQTFPPNPVGLTAHGDLLAAQKKFLPAIEEYKRALALDPSHQNSMARLAVSLLGQLKKEEAEEIYNKLATLEPKSPDILLQMGNYWLLQGDRKTGDLFLRKAIKQVPKNHNLQIKLAELYINSGQFSDAVVLFKQLLQKSPTNRFYKKMLFESLLLSKNFTETSVLISELSIAENQDIDFSLLKGKYYLNTGEYPNAASQFASALEKEPNLPLTHYFLALSYIANGQNHLGRSHLMKSLTLNRHFTEAELTLADCYYKTGDYELALKHVARIQKREPENYRAYLLEGIISVSLKNFDYAFEALSKAYTLKPNSQTVQFYLGILFSLTDKPDQALPLIKNVLANNPLLADVTLVYTQTLYRQGQHNKATDYLEEIIAAHSTSPYLQHIYGLTLLSTGKRRKAIKAFKTAIHIAPDMKESYLQLFDIYQNNSRKLEEILIEATSKLHNFEEALIRLASLYNRTDQSDKAIAILQEALSRNPSSPFLANNLAYLYLEHRPDNVNEAMRLAILAYEKMPDSTAIADTLGWAYYKKNNLIRAEWLLKEAANSAPSNPHIINHLTTIRKSSTNKHESSRQIENQP